MVRLADDICGLTLLEVHDLTTILKKRLGLDAMPMMGMPMGGAAMGGAPAAGGAAAAPEEAAAEKTEFDVKLASFDSASKIKVIKEVRAITELGLKEAKDLVEGAPAVLKKGLKKEEAEAIKEKLAKVGGVVTLE
jgi:large subunit ribosomal protein L7/L12